MLLLRSPAVYRPQGDTWFLADAFGKEAFSAETSVLDLCTGSGALAVLARRFGAGRVTAIDISRRAVLATLINTRSRGLPVRVLRGDLLAPVAGERFDVIVSNPPYVPAPDDRLPTGGAARCWDAGVDGRAVLDRICTEAPAHLNPGGVLLVVASSVCDEGRTVEQLERAGLTAEVVGRAAEPFGPVMTARAKLLEGRGLIAAGQRVEELVVVRAQSPG